MDVAPRPVALVAGLALIKPPGVYARLVAPIGGDAAPPVRPPPLAEAAWNRTNKKRRSRDDPRKRRAGRCSCLRKWMSDRPDGRRVRRSPRGGRGAGVAFAGTTEAPLDHPGAGRATRARGAAPRWHSLWHALAQDGSLCHGRRRARCRTASPETAADDADDLAVQDNRHTLDPMTFEQRRTDENRAAAARSFSGQIQQNPPTAALRQTRPRRPTSLARARRPVLPRKRTHLRSAPLGAPLAPRSH